MPCRREDTQPEMPPLYKLNAPQLATLRWIAEGAPEGVMEGYAHRISAAALKSRGLVRISGQGAGWQAQITPVGQAHLNGPASTIDQPELRDNKGSVSSSTSLAVSRGEETELRADPAPPKNPAPLVRQPEITVPATLRGAHQFVIATQKAAVGLRAESDGRIRVGPQTGVVHVAVSRPLLRRALLIVQGLLREAIKRGWEVIAHTGTGYGDRPGVAIEIRGHRYPLEIYELTESLPFTEAEIAAWRTESNWKWEIERRADNTPPPQLKRKRATGRLRLLLPNGYGGGRATWAEGPRGPLGSKLPSVLRTLEQRARADDEASVKRARLAEEREREQEAREAQARRARIESARVERLLAEVAAWRRSADVRCYLDELEEELPLLVADERARLAKWCSWARGWANRSDPSRHTSLIAGLDQEHDQLLGRQW